MEFSQKFSGISNASFSPDGNFCAMVSGQKIMV